MRYWTRVLPRPEAWCPDKELRVPSAGLYVFDECAEEWAATPRVSWIRDHNVERTGGQAHQSAGYTTVRACAVSEIQSLWSGCDFFSSALSSYISEFLDKKLLIRLQNKGDLGIMLPMFTELCELDWSTLNVAERKRGEDDFLTFFRVLHFLHQILVRLYTPLNFVGLMDKCRVIRNRLRWWHQSSIQLSQLLWRRCTMR